MKIDNLEIKDLWDDEVLEVEVYSKLLNDKYINQLKEVLKCERIQELMKTGNFNGELSSPDTNSLIKICSIDLTNISHKILSWRFDKNKMYAKIKLRQNDNTDILKECIKNKEAILKIRLLTNKEANDLIVITFDIVCNKLNKRKI